MAHISQKQMEVYMNKADMIKKISRLESANDQLESEIIYIDNLLRSVGFPQGLASAKEVAMELLENPEQTE